MGRRKRRPLCVFRFRNDNAVESRASRLTETFFLLDYPINLAFNTLAFPGAGRFPLRTTVVRRKYFVSVSGRIVRIVGRIWRGKGGPEKECCRVLLTELLPRTKSRFEYESYCYLTFVLSLGMFWSTHTEKLGNTEKIPGYAQDRKLGHYIFKMTQFRLNWYGSGVHS